MTIIPLGPALLTGSSDLPGDLGRAVLRRLPIWPCSVRGLACHLPCGKRGALLPHLFTLTRRRPYGRRRAGPCGPTLDATGSLSPPHLGRSWRGPNHTAPLRTVNRSRLLGGMFSVPLSFELPRPGVTRRTALWSSDFPPAFARLRGLRRGGMFSVPLSFELPRPAVNRRTALRSSDFPPFDSPLRGSLRAGSCYRAHPPGRYIFCATFLRVAPTGRYPAHCPAEFGLSSSVFTETIVWPTAAALVLTHVKGEGRREKESSAFSLFLFPSPFCLLP